MICSALAELLWWEKSHGQLQAESFVVHHSPAKELCNDPKAIGALLQLGEELVGLFGSSLQRPLDAEGLPEFGCTQGTFLVVLSEAARIVGMAAQEMHSRQLQWSAAQRILAILEHLCLHHGHRSERQLDF